MAATKELLRDLAGAEQVEILLGSGSLANDVVAGQLTLLEQPGLIVSNGEFGERLIDHATRFGLEFDCLKQADGEAFENQRLSSWIADHPQARWLWGVHCETSTGVLNDIQAWKSIARQRSLRLCLDCVSSIGTVPVDLRGVYLASCVSGKGLRGYPGLSMVFYGHEVAPAPARLPRYLDLGSYADQRGVPFTHSSNLLAALHAALQAGGLDERFARLRREAARLRESLRRLGFRVIGDDTLLSPAVTTVELPAAVDSESFGDELERSGYLLNYRSTYLLQRNRIQVCLMGEFESDELNGLLTRLADNRPGRAGASPANLSLASSLR
jgi:aspartate aminotransferase-like enzyme